MWPAGLVRSLPKSDARVTQVWIAGTAAGDAYYYSFVPEQLEAVVAGEDSGCARSPPEVVSARAVLCEVFF